MGVEILSFWVLPPFFPNLILLGGVLVATCPYSSPFGEAEAWLDLARPGGGERDVASVEYPPSDSSELLSGCCLLLGRGRFLLLGVYGRASLTRPAAATGRATAFPPAPTIPGPRLKWMWSSLELSIAS